MKGLALGLGLIAALAMPLMGSCSKGGGSAQVAASSPQKSPPDDSNFNRPKLGPGPGGKSLVSQPAPPATVEPPAAKGGDDHGISGTAGTNPGKETPVPEPTTLILVGLGLAAAGMATRRRQRA